MADPVIAFPGTLCDRRLFEPMFAALGPAFTVADMGAADSAAGIADAILASAPPRFLAVGFSLGGFPVLDLAVRAPQRLTGLVLIGANARPDRPENLDVRRGQWRKAVSEGFEPLMRELWPTYVAEERRGDAALFDTVLSMAEAIGLSAFGRQVRIAHGRPDRRPDLAEIRLPALVVRGDKDQLSTPDQQAEMVAAMPFAQSVTIPAAGHFAPLEAPLAMASALRDWSRMSGIAA